MSHNEWIKGKRILLVEDEILLALPLTEEIEDAGGIVVGPCPSLAKCRGPAQSEALDGAILDMNLGGEFVWPVAQILRSRGIPFIFVTGYTDPASFPEEMRSVPRLSKPAVPADALARLAQLAQSA